jgi:hypothetical protein
VRHVHVGAYATARAVESDVARWLSGLD